MPVHFPHKPRTRVTTMIASAIVTIAACGSPSASTTTSTVPEGSAPASSETTAVSGSAPTSARPDIATGTIEGLFDVGGHNLYLRCEGEASPTIVYMHGAITNEAVDPHSNGLGIQSALQDDYRVCVYDRRNLGHSDTVDAVQTPTDAITDMHNLLVAAEVEPPYVLLGASFGGLLAYLYANTYPDEVIGMVQLDSPFPDEMSLEPLVPVDDQYEAFEEEDANSLERISHYLAHTDAVPFIGQEPDIPLTYFASLQEPWDEFGVPEYDAQIMDVLAAYVDRFSPGTFIEVDSPHFMEPEIPDDIVEALRDVIAQAD